LPESKPKTKHIPIQLDRAIYNSLKEYATAMNQPVAQSASTLSYPAELLMSPTLERELLVSYYASTTAEHKLQLLSSKAAKPVAPGLANFVCGLGYRLSGELTVSPANRRDARV